MSLFSFLYLFNFFCQSSSTSTALSTASHPNCSQAAGSITGIPPSLFLSRNFPIVGQKQAFSILL